MKNVPLPRIGRDGGIPARGGVVLPRSGSCSAPGPAAGEAKSATRGFAAFEGVIIAGALVAAAAMFMAAASNTYTITGKAAAAAGYPSDPTIGGRLLVAQELAAERETAGLERAIGLLEGVTAQAPGFAPGHAGLAEALILSREFGARADADAFRQARAAAMAAVRIDPDLASGHRLLGFISYWKDGDFAQAQKRFERALALDPNDVLSHFWYGNILSDRGDHGSALAELERARTLDPGSVAIRTDLAWAQWAAGQDAVAIPALQEIARSNPGFPVAQDCLAIIALVNGDDKGYVAHFTRFALARQDKRLMRKAQHLAEAGPARLRRLVYEQALSDVAEGSRGRAWPVLVASLRGDRRAVMQLLQAAEREHEVWGDAALVPRIRAVWKNDRRIAAMIDLRVGGISLASR